MSPGWVVKAAAAVVVRPVLWRTAVRQLWLLRRRRWYRIAPFLPVPDPAYVKFRLVTAYGDPDRAPEPDDVVTYLRWCRDGNVRP